MASSEIIVGLNNDMSYPRSQDIEAELLGIVEASERRDTEVAVFASMVDSIDEVTSSSLKEGLENTMCCKDGAGLDGAGPFKVGCS